MYIATISGLYGKKNIIEKLYYYLLRSEEKKSAHVFVCITRIMLGLDKNQSNQQKVHILRIPNW